MQRGQQDWQAAMAHQVWTESTGGQRIVAGSCLEGATIRITGTADDVVPNLKRLGAVRTPAKVLGSIFLRG